MDATTHKGDYTCNVTNMAGSESKTSTVVGKSCADVLKLNLLLSNFYSFS